MRIVHFKRLLGIIRFYKAFERATESTNFEVGIVQKQHLFTPLSEGRDSKEKIKRENRPHTKKNYRKIGKYFFFQHVGTFIIISLSLKDVFFFVVAFFLKLIKFYLCTHKKSKAPSGLRGNETHNSAISMASDGFVATPKCRFFDSVARCVQCQTGRRKRSATRHVWKMHRIFSLAACMLNIRCVANSAFKCVSSNMCVICNRVH